MKRYGDADDDEFAKAHGTIPQRLLMMNGDLVDGKAKEELLNASTQIAMFAPDDAAAVETAYLTVLTRRPTEGTRHFTAKLAGTGGDERRSAPRGPVLGVVQLDGVGFQSLTVEVTAFFRSNRTACTGRPISPESGIPPTRRRDRAASDERGEGTTDLGAH